MRPARLYAARRGTGPDVWSGDQADYRSLAASRLLLRHKKARQMAGFCVLRLDLVAVDRELGAERLDLLADARFDRLVAQVGEDLADPAGQLAAFVFLEAAGGHGRGADAQARGDEGRARIVGHAVLVHGDEGAAQGG